MTESNRLVASQVKVAHAGHICFDEALSGDKDPPVVGQLRKATGVRRAVGGPGAAASVASARLGAKSSFMGLLGHDLHGGFILEELNRLGVDVSGVEQTDDESTSFTHISVNGEGQRAFDHFVGTNAMVSDTHINLDVVAECKGLLIAGIGLLPALEGDPCARVMKRARDRGMVTAINTVHPGHEDAGGSLKALRPSLPHTTIAIISTKELAQFTGYSDPGEAVRFLHAEGAENAVITMGPKGLLVGTPNDPPQQIPAYDVKPKDKTGAGDGTSPATLVRFLEGYSIFEAAAYGCAVGNIIVRAGQGTAGVVPEAEVLEFMANTPRLRV